MKHRNRRSIRHRIRHGIKHGKKKWIPIVLIILLIVCLGWELYQIQLRQKEYEQLASETSWEDERVTIEWNGKTYVLRDDLYSILLIGTDNDFEAEVPGRCDFTTLMVVDKTENCWKLLQLNRDTMCNVSTLNAQGKVIGSKREQLALAHSYGTGKVDSCRNTIRAVKDLLYGIAIEDYIRISVDSVADLNDVVGGVTVTLEDDFSQFDKEMVAGATLTLTGEQAETFVRSRMGMEDATNENRMARQRVYLANWLEAAGENVDPSSLAKKMEKTFFTSLSVYDMSDLVECLEEFDSPQIITVEGTAKQGSEYVEFEVDEQALQQQVIDLFYQPIKE